MLISKIRGLLSEQGLKLNIVLARPLIERAEKTFGHPLPDLLKTLCETVANGGFGPAGGLLPLTEGRPDEKGRTSLGLWQIYSKEGSADPSWHWPDGLLPVCHWGCAIYSCVNCLDRKFTMVTFDPNQHSGKDSWDRCYFRDSRTFDEWMKDWVEGRDDELMFGRESGQ